MLVASMLGFQPPLRDGPQCSSGAEFPNIAYLGAGYDMVIGNPEPWVSNSGGSASGLAMDPGWKGTNIVDMQDYSAGGNYDGCKIPNAVINNILKTESCQYSAVYQELGDAASYQHHLHVDASASAHAGFGGFGASFSASSDYDSLTEGTSSEQSIFFANAAICQMYTASLPSYTPFNLTKDFRAGVASLPTNLESGVDALVEFVRTFGTHFTSRIVMGAKSSLIFSMTRSSYSEFSSKGFDVKAAMSVSFGCFGGASGHTHVDKSDSSYKKFDSLDKKTIISCVGAGGQCPLLDNQSAPNDWASLAKQSPTALRYELRSVADLLTYEYFDNATEPHIQDKQGVLYNFLVQDYCTHVAPALQKQCIPPARDGYWVPVADIGTRKPTMDALTGGERDRLAVTSLGGQLYAVGGSAGGAGLTSMEILSPTTNTWKAARNMSTPRYALGVGALNGRVVAIGGYGPDGTLNSTEVYDPQSDTWATGPPMATPRYSFAVGQLNQALYAVGGCNGQYCATILNSVEMFDGYKWTPAPSMHHPRSALGVSVLDGKMYAIGGNGGGQSIEVFDGTKWSPGPDMSMPRSAMGVGVLNDKLLYVIGGMSTDGAALMSVEAFDPLAQTWSGQWTKDTRPADLFTARHSLGVDAIGDRIYVVGGNDGRGVVKSVEAYKNVSLA